MVLLTLPRQCFLCGSFSAIYILCFHCSVGLGFLEVQNFELYYFFGGGGYLKKQYFLGYGDFVDIFGGHHKIGLYLGVISMHFKVFS